MMEGARGFRVAHVQDQALRAVRPSRGHRGRSAVRFGGARREAPGRGGRDVEADDEGVRRDVPHPGRGSGAGGDPRDPAAREREPSGLCARYLNVTTGLVSQWERGEKRPHGASLKLLTLVAKNGLGAGPRDGCRPGRAGGARPFPSGAISGGNGSGHLVTQWWGDVGSAKAGVSIKLCES